MSLVLREYQERCLADLFGWFERHPDGDPIVEASVGAGKSVLIAELCRRAIAAHPATRILMCVHVKELIQQNLQKLLAVWPGAPVGVYSASVGSRQLGRPITYATIGSVAKRAHQLGQVDLLLIDECHLVSPSETTMYRRLIDDLRRYCPAMRVIGWTGTAFRGNGVRLTHAGLFTHIAARVTMRELLDQAFLAPLVVPEVHTQLSTEGVRLSGGDYVVSQLEAAVNRADLVAAACAELARLAAERRSWLVFCATVKHAQAVAAQLASVHGVRCQVVSAQTPPAERDRVIGDFKAGRIRALVNVAVLTTGFDAPMVDCVALLRPTKSPVMYVQIAGRGMRTADGKTDCLWLDFTSTTADLGPVDQIRGRDPAPPGQAPFKYCDDCGEKAAVMALVCADCGFQFPPPAEPDRERHEARASAASVMSSADGIQWTTVSDVEYREHGGRDGKPPTLQVAYFAGWKRVAAEWLCFDHEPMSYPRRKALAWWRERARSDRAGLPGPASVGEAMERIDELRPPRRIATVMDGQYARVVSVELEPPAPDAKEAA